MLMWPCSIILATLAGPSYQQERSHRQLQNFSFLYKAGAWSLLNVCTGFHCLGDEHGFKHLGNDRRLSPAQ